MNLIDKAITWALSRPAAKGLRARIVNEAMLAYDGARSARRQGGWLTSNASGNSEISIGRAKLTANARDLCRNNPYGRKAKREWGKRIVGTGILPRPKTGDEKLNKLILQYWDIWVKQCCSDQRRNFYGEQKSIVDSTFESGECLVRFWQRRPTDGYVVPFHIQVLEADYLDDSKTQTTDTGFIVNGVDFDKIGRLRGYWLFENHPGEFIQSNLKGSYQSKFIPAEYILHHAVFDRPGDVRAVTRLASVIAKLRDIDEYSDAHIVRKKIAACITMVLTQTDGDDGKTFGPVTVDDDGKSVESFSPGMMPRVPQGFDAKPFTPADDSDYSGYKKTELMEVAAGLGIPYFILDENLEGVNFSSGRLGLLGYKGDVEEYRYNWLIPQILDPIYRKFIDTLILSTLIPSSIGNDIENAIYKVEWNPPQFDLMDRTAEAAADETELRTGKTTWPQMVAAAGRDPEEQLAEIEKYKPRLEAAGVKYTQNAAPTQPQGDANAATK